MKSDDVEVKYLGPDTITVRLRDRRNVAFGPGHRTRAVSPGDARDLVSLGRGSFERVKASAPPATPTAKVPGKKNKGGDA